MKRAGIILAVIGVFLHIYTLLFKASGPVSGTILLLLLISILPYLVCGFLLFKMNNKLIPFAGILPCLVMDVIAYYQAFINPQSSTDSLGLVAVPLYNLVVFMPAGMLAGWGISKLLRKKT